MHRKNILLYIQQDTTLHSLFYLETTLHVYIAQGLRDQHYATLTFNVHGSVHRKNILLYIQQDATLHSLFYLETALDVYIAQGLRDQHYATLTFNVHGFVHRKNIPLLLPAAIAVGSSNGLTNTRCCRYSCLRSC